MAEIIKREVIKIRNGGLASLCKKNNTNIAEVARKTRITEQLLRLFNKGERTLKWEDWEKVINYLDSLQK